MVGEAPLGRLPPDPSTDQHHPPAATILCLGVHTAETRALLGTLLPPGFVLAFGEGGGSRPTRELMAEADFVLVWTVRLTAELVSAGTKVRLIQKIGEGTDKIDVEAARRACIPVAKTTGANTVSTAEMAMALMLAALRRLPEADHSLREHAWRKWDVRANTYELRGKQVGIIGLGKVGRVVAGYVRAFGATVAYHNRHRLPEDDEALLLARYLTLDELLRTSDIVSLHLPSDATTRGLLGREQIALMKRSAVVINTSRGDLIDEVALAEALQERRILGAGLDVFSSEPPDWSSPIFGVRSAALTPHMAGVTEDSQVELIRHAFDNFARVAAGVALDPEDVVVACPPVAVP